MPIEQAFLGSYDLTWNFVGRDENGNAVIEFHLVNASYYNSAKIDPGKVQNYPGQGDPNTKAGECNDLLPGETCFKQSIRWRETFVDDQPPVREEYVWGTADNCCVPGL